MSDDRMVTGVATLNSDGSTGESPTQLTSARPTVRGKFLFVDDVKLVVRGVTYGAFRPNDSGNEFHDLAKIDADFGAMAAAGFNVVRIPHTTPPRDLLDIAQRHGLLVMVGLSVEQHIGHLIDHPFRASRRIEHELREKVRICAGHSAVLCYALGNEIPARVVRYVGPARIEKFLRRMCDAVRDEDPEALVTYVNYPTTEYLDLYFLDLIAMNVYLEDEGELSAYLARLQNLAGERPLLLSELGLDSLRNGEDGQASTLDWQIRTAAASGCVGVVVFSWTDEWYRGGEDVDDWAFGLTDRQRRPKPALVAVQNAFASVESPVPKDPPSISVVLCSYNGSRTISETVDGLLELEYPDFELIVVDDGSIDNTAELADRPGIRLIRAEHHGLSSARNTGLRAATGDIVAYIDDDAYPDRDWLAHLSRTFLTTTHAGVGGPNISPPTDGPIHQCVSNSPGNPSHVLIDDIEAEHIPGCNMAFRREALQAIDGFDEQFRSAGDDVDVCWRLRNAGFTLGFSPAAVVWHHRRGTIRAYMKQQIGYGRAEALLAGKWREQLDGRTQVDWLGTIYGGGHTRPLMIRRPIVYHGIWGQAPFQSLYQPRPGKIPSLFLAPRFGLYVLGFAALALLGVLSVPLSWLAVLPLVLAIGVLGAQAIISARRAVFPAHTLEEYGRSRLVATTSLLHFAQPTARLWGQLRRAPAERKVKRQWSRLAWPLPVKRMLWTDDWRADDLRLSALEDELGGSDADVYRGSSHSKWDLEVRGGRFGAARSCLAGEDHMDAHQLVRVRVWPQIGNVTLAILATLSALLAIAVADSAWLVSSIFGSLLVAGAVFTLLQCSRAMGAFATLLRRDGYARHVGNE